MANRRLKAFAITIGLSISFAHSSLARGSETECANLQSRIDAAIKSNVRRLDLPTGARCKSPPLVISGASNLIIDGHGSTLVFNKWNEPGISITKSSSNVTLRDISIDYDPIPFTQGTITSIGKSEIHFLVDPGYPPISQLGHLNRAYLFDSKTRLWKRGAKTIYFRTIQSLDGAHARITPRPQDIPQIEIGDLIALPTRLSPAIRINGLSSTTTLQHVSIQASPGMGVLSRFVLGDNQFQIAVTRGPRPEGAKTERLLSTNADAFNYGYARKGPTLSNSTIGFQGDDGVNLHGPTLAIVRTDSPNSLILGRPNGSDDSLIRIMQPGDPVRILAKENFAILKTAILKRIEKINPPPHNSSKVAEQYYPRAKLENTRPLTYYRITVDGPTPRDGAFVDFPAINAPNFKILNNNFHDNRGHGIVTGASDGEIINNTMQGMTQNAIIAGANYTPWRESGWVKNISISNNTITDACYDPDMVSAPDAWAFGAISIGARLDDSTTAYPLDNADITISNNTVDGCANGHALYLNAVSGITLSGNHSSQTGGKNSGKVNITRKDGLLDVAIGSARGLVDVK